MIFRNAEKSDAETIAKLVNQAYRPQPGASGWTHESLLVSGDRTTVAQVAELMAKPDSTILVGITDNAITACVHVEKDGQHCHIGMLAVNPILQGAGLGKQILAYAERFARERFEADKFILLVLSARTELIDFYRRRGYAKTGRVLDYPLAAGVGTPRHCDLKIEVLEKQPTLPPG